MIENDEDIVDKAFDMIDSGSSVNDTARALGVGANYLSTLLANSPKYQQEGWHGYGDP